MKSNLTTTTALARGVSGGEADVETVVIRDLPQIDPADFPAVPADMEMRLLQGEAPCIVLWHPETELRLHVPLTDMEALGPHVVKLRQAVDLLVMARGLQ
jgi:hypothetical protein